MEILLSAVLVGVTWLILLGGWRRSVEHIDLTPSFGALVLGLLAVGAAVWLYGIMAGLAIILVILVHEFGHVAAYRVAGHDDATFRLIPFFGGVAISRQMPASRAHDFFITAMGPGICLALMCLAFSAAQIWQDGPVQDFLFTVGVFAGLLNFFNLLPLWPLDGGRMVHALIGAVAPVLADRLMYLMGALLLLVALFTQSVLLFIFGLLSFQAISGSAAATRSLAPLSPGQAMTGLLALGFMAAAFWKGAEPILAGFLQAAAGG